MEELTLLRDFAVIMVVAGMVTVVFRKLKQPVIPGYLIAGLIIGPYTPPFLLVSNVQTVNMMADLGIVLLLFAMGLEFSWNKIRKIGSSVILIGFIEIVTMISLGYGIGKLLGWSDMDALFLGAALHVTSSAFIVKVLRDTGRLNFLSSRLIVGISVLEDFVAVAVIALISQITVTRVTNISDVGVMMLRLVIFVLVTLVIGRLIIPRLLKFVHKMQSRETLLITGLGLCFALALIGNYLGLSIAAGAFLIGVIIGDTEYSKDIAAVVSPVRDMFAAIFFVSIGMLINIMEFGGFIVPTMIVFVVFLAGKILINTVATFLSGYDGRISLNVGVGMPQMGEFSLMIAKTGLDRGVLLAPLYPVIVLVTTLTSLTTPYLVRNSEKLAYFLERSSPQLLKTYVSRLGGWLEALRKSFSTDTVSSHIIQHATKSVIINICILLVLISAGTFTLRFASHLSEFSGIRIDILVLIFSLLLLVLCLPCFISIWRNVRNVADMASGLWLNRTFAGKASQMNAFRIILRDSIVIILAVLVMIWFIPYLLELFYIGYYALLIPLLLVAFVIYLILRFAFDIHGQIERAFSQVIFGQEHVSPSKTSELSHSLRKAFKRLFKLKDGRF